MPSRSIELESESFYHVYNRGWNKQKIFFSDNDYSRFVTTLERYLKDFPGIEIYAFALIPNHFHLLLRSTKSGLEISDFMRKIQQSHAMYFNKYLKKDKSGLRLPVFEGRFRSMVIEREDYLEQVYHYVELNPIKHELVSDIKDWLYTSFHKRSFHKILTEF